MAKDVYSIVLFSHNLKRCRYSSSQFFESGNTCGLRECSKFYELGYPAHASYVVRLTGIGLKDFLRWVFVTIVGISFAFETLQKLSA